MKVKNLLTHLLEAKFEADAALAVSLLTHLGPLVALCLVVELVAGLGTLGRGAITHGLSCTLLLGSTQEPMVGLYKFALSITARPDAWTTLRSPLQFAT